MDGQTSDRTTSFAQEGPGLGVLFSRNYWWHLPLLSECSDLDNIR